MKQLSIDLNPDITKVFGTCREYVANRSHLVGMSQKAIAAEMDYSPSDLTRKLAQSPNDSRRFTLDDLEKFIEVTGDTEPVKYLVAKYLVKAEETELDLLRARVAELEGRG